MWDLLRMGLMALAMGICTQVGYANDGNQTQEPLLFNYVTHIELNGLDISHEVPMNQMSSMFRQQYELAEMQYQGATGDLHIVFKGKDTFAVFLTDMNGLPEAKRNAVWQEFEATGESPTWQALLKQDGGKWLMESDLLGAWDITWLSMKSFQEELKLDGQVISAELTLTQFGQMFPVSMGAKRVFQDDSSENEIREVYYVTIDPMVDGDLPYWDHLEFVFEQEKLAELLLVRGIRY